MHQLSAIARNFLSTQERSSSTTIKGHIIESFKANNAPIFEPLIEFQINYSGYQFKAGLESIHFGLLQGDGGYPERTNTAIIDFYESYTGNSKYQFVCATSQYQMEFTLDEFGRYYEDSRIVASSFDKTIEHLAIWDQIRKTSGFQVLLRNQQLLVQDLDMKLDLKLIPAASDEYTLWFQNDSTYLQQCNGFSTIITKENSDKIKLILAS